MTLFDRAVVRLRTIVIFACLVVGLLPILRMGFAPEVHAADVILVTTPVDAIARDGACSLREAIITANTNAPVFSPAVPPGECTHNGTPGLDTIVLQVPGPFVLTIPGPGEQAAATGDLDIVDDLTLQGEGQTVDAGTLDRAFDVIGATVLISGTIIQNGYVEGSFGGGIHNDAGQLALVNSYVTDSSAAADIGVGARGGGIYTTGALTLTNSHVARNSLQDTVGATMPGDLLGGGGIYNDGGALRIESGSTIQFNLIPDFFSPWAGLATSFRGGGIYNALGGSLVITGTSVITENYILDPVGITGGDCEFAGAGIFNGAGSVMTTTASAITQNGAIDISGSTSCHFLGGGIHNQGQVLLAGCRVEGNTANDSGLGYAGGAGLYNATGAAATVVQGSDLSGNRAAWDGGGLYNAAGGTVTFIDSAASTNVAEEYGGGLYNEGTMVISQTSILTNTAMQGGGGVENRGSLRVDAATFSGNATQNLGGGGFANRDGSVDVTHSHLSDNQAATHGGGIWNNHTLNLAHVTIIGNDAGGEGGGLYSGGIAATASLTYTTILSNTAWNGGGLYNITGTVTLGAAADSASGVELRGNMANGRGGGIYNNGTMGITATHILTNTALESGGGVYNTGLATLSGGVVLTNAAQTGGGGICNTGALTLTQTTLAANVASQAGGIENQGTLLIDQGVIRDNEARAYGGGGIHNLDGVVSAIRSMIAENRAAGDGGGIWNQGRLVLDSTSLSKNEADAGSVGFGRGGGVYNEGVASRVALTDTTVISNTAQDGAGLCNLEGILTVHAGQVSENVAGGGAGGIHNEGIAVLEATTIAANVAASDGGGINNTNQATLTITGTAIMHNEAQGLNGGGGIFSIDSTATLTNSIVAYNWASDTDGGGIWNGTTLDLTNVTLSGNTAQARGGGLFNNFGSTSRLTHATVAFNEAVLGTGGGLYLKEQITSTLRNSIVSNNTGENCAGLGSTTSAGYNLDSDGTCQLAGSGDLANTDPQLGPLQDNGGPTDTHALLLGSPAANVIPPGLCPLSTDQRGVTRPQGPACDIGAYEAVWAQLYLPIVLKSP